MIPHGRAAHKWLPLCCTCRSAVSRAPASGPNNSSASASARSSVLTSRASTPLGLGVFEAETTNDQQCSADCWRAPDHPEMAFLGRFRDHLGIWGENVLINWGTRDSRRNSGTPQVEPTGRVLWPCLYDVELVANPSLILATPRETRSGPDNADRSHTVPLGAMPTVIVAPRACWKHRVDPHLGAAQGFCVFLPPLVEPGRAPSCPNGRRDTLAPRGGSENFERHA